MPAWAGSSLTRAMAYGRTVPTRTDNRTMVSNDAVMAVALARSCVLSHTRAKLPTDRPVPSSSATSPCDTLPDAEGRTHLRAGQGP